MANAQTTSLVTGGAGFIGSHVARELLAMGHRVVVLDDLSGGYRDHVPEKAIFVQGSVTDHELLEKLFNENKFQYVYHLAAYAAVGLSHFIRRFNYNNNLIGSTNLINESVKHNVDCFVFASSISVYGNLKPPMHESTPPVPEDPYGIAKYAVEQDLRSAHEMFGLKYVIFRPHNVFGEYQNIGDRYRNVVGIFMNQLISGNPLPIFGDGKQTRAFSYISDVAPYIARSVDVPGALNQVFNIGADQTYTVNELANATMKAMNLRSEIRYLQARNEPLHVYSDHEKVRKVFSIKSATPLEVGLKNMADWAKRVGARKSLPFSQIEVSRNLPPFWLES